jgi:hypothetical protein
VRLALGRLVSALCAGLLAYLTFTLVRDLTGRPRLALAGAFLVALPPMVGQASGTLNPDILLAATTPGLARACVRLDRERRLGNVYRAGWWFIAVGATKPIGIALAAAVAVSFLGVPPLLRLRGRAAGVAAGAGAIVAAALAADDLTFHVRSRAALRALLPDLGASRFARSLERTVTTDPAWTATLARVARVVRATTPPDAVVGSVTKWDPTLLALAGRRGRQVPDRRLLPDGYPADDILAIDHIERLRREGLSHLVFPRASFWWLEHYPRLAELLRREHTELHADRDSVIFDLRSAA